MVLVWSGKNLVPCGSVVGWVHSISLQICADWPGCWIGTVAFTSQVECDERLWVLERKYQRCKYIQEKKMRQKQTYRLAFYNCEFISAGCLSVRVSLHMRRQEKPTTCHWMLYCTYDMFNMFRALLCPSGARDYMCVITAYGVRCLGCWLL